MIKIAENHEEYVKCFKVLSPLRPHLTLDEFVAGVTRMHDTTGYRLVYLTDNDIKAVAGFRVSEWLHSGKYLEIEEFITQAGERSKGYGAQLFDWALAYAKQQGCAQLRLVSGVSRELAHKFYTRKGMVFEAKYFSIDV